MVCSRASIVSGLVSVRGIAPPARLSWPPAVPRPSTTSRRTSPEWPPSWPTRTESLSRFSNRPTASAQFTWSNRMKKSASSAMMSGWVTVAAPAHDHVVIEERVGQGVLERGEVALGELGVADLGQQVLVGAGEEPDERAVVERAGLAGVAGGLRLDPVEQGRRQPGRDRHVLLEQVAGDHRAGGPEVGADVAEEDAGEHAAGLVVVDARPAASRPRWPAGRCGAACRP